MTIFVRAPHLRKTSDQNKIMHANYHSRVCTVAISKTSMHANSSFSHITIKQTEGTDCEKSASNSFQSNKNPQTKE